MSNFYLRSLTTIVLTYCFTTAHTALANAIGVHNTGENGGSALAVGVADPHYKLVSAPAGVPLTAVTTSPNGVWTNNTTTADWISPSNSGYDSWPIGDYDYQTTFDLTGSIVSTATLSGLWTSDNNACIYLNGINTTNCTGYASFYSGPQAFSITSGFQSGINTLDFVVTNGGDGGSPSGVFAQVSGTVSPSDLSAVPEPSSILAGTAVFGLAGALRRRLVKA